MTGSVERRDDGRTELDDGVERDGPEELQRSFCVVGGEQGKCGVVLRGASPVGEAEGEGRGHVHPQHLNRKDWQGRRGDDGREDDQALPHARREGPDDELGQVVEHPATLFDRPVGCLHVSAHREVERVDRFSVGLADAGKPSRPGWRMRSCDRGSFAPPKAPTCSSPAREATAL
ncbi:MAG: hypothetical protein ACRD03_09190 [Acidimicrobiales bacterium]